jgi:1-aminocyclopropane-1-carboxylate deaminase
LYLDYHQGGYAKTNPELNEFISSLAAAGVPTEFIYTGKLFWAAVDLIGKKIIEPGSTVLILHTGGLQSL